MYNVVLLNYVNGDGIGDVMHLIDIYQALKKNPAFKSFRFWPVICCVSTMREAITKELRAAGISAYFLGTKKEYADTKKDGLQQVFNETKQVIQVSYSAPFILPEHYSFPEGTLFKYMGEHEYHPLSHPFAGFCSDLSAYNFIMGLSTHYGIKISAEPPVDVSAAEVFSIATKELTANEGRLQQRLLEETGSADMISFVSGNVLYPAYFNDINGLFLFIYFLGITAHADNKDIALVLSGKNRNISKEIWQKFLHDRDTSFSPRYSVAFCDCSETASRSYSPADSTDISDTETSPTLPIIRVFYGARLEPDRYHTLYQQAAVAGVSGDNTFEKAVSCHALPFYCSTNALIKKSTFLALAKMMRDESLCPSLPAGVRKDFLTYFENFFNFIHGMPFDDALPLLDELDEEPTFDEVDYLFSQLNIDNMAQYWPIIAEHLRQHHNFYKLLPDSVLQTHSHKTVEVFPGINAATLSYYLASAGSLIVALAIVLQVTGYSYSDVGSVAVVGIAILLSGFGLFERDATRQLQQRQRNYVAREALSRAIEDGVPLHASETSVGSTAVSTASVGYGVGLGGG